MAYSALFPAPLRINRQTMIETKEPTKAEIRSSNVILISVRPRSMWNNQKRNPPNSAPIIPIPHVGPESEAALGKSHHTPSQCPSQRADDQPNNNFASRHRSNPFSLRNV